MKTIINKLRRLRYYVEKVKFRHHCKKLANRSKSPFFVKIGANDGITGDPCSDIFLKDLRWRGVLVEPIPHCFDALRQNYDDPKRFILEQAAISSRSIDKIVIYYVDPKASEEIADLPEWFDQLGSFSRNHIVKHLDGALEPYIRELEVEALTLQQLIEKHNCNTIDLLHIDVEGFDYQVLKTLDFNRQKTRAIFIEYRHLSNDDQKSLYSLLAEHFLNIKDCGGDYFAY